MSSFSPFLKIGTILAFLRIEGKIPLLTDSLKRLDIIMEKGTHINLIMKTGISSRAQLLFFTPIIIFSTSVLVDGDIKKEELTGLDK